jgi:aspartyl-tRNA(Asn)/glutamyl-tRNA(Gln) amidotransferase subunit A
MNDNDLAYASIEEIGRLFRKRKLSPVELTRLILGRIERAHGELNAYIVVTAEFALAQAKKAEAELFAPRGRTLRDRGPLHGIPISLKDNIYTAGIRTTGGSQILRDFVPLQDAHVVALLKKAGAVIVGKNNLHEFAYGVTSNNPHYGAVRNPWDVRRIPGGSSGGSAAAVAAGLCYGSVGTDTGGSIRIPAALCGVIGVKPSAGLVSLDGIIPLSPLLDYVGPLARTSQDAALLLRAISSPAGKRAARPPARENRRGDLRKFRLGVPREFFFEVISEEVRSIFGAELQRLSKDRAEVVEISVPLLNETEDAGNQIAWAEATHYHQQSGWYPSRAADYGDDVRARLEIGTRVPATRFLEALETRENFTEQLRAAMAEAQVDALVVPATPIAAPLIEEETTRIAGQEFPTRALLLRLNRPANLAGVPALSVPCGRTSSGLPVGLQVIGRRAGEQAVLVIARFVESHHPGRSRPLE